MKPAKVQILPLRRTPSDKSDATAAKQSCEHVTAKKKRTSQPKVRSGCVTCKIRRVKCDETKPACNRCTSTGRKCDGYKIKPRKKRSRPGLREDEAPHKSPALVLGVGPSEIRSLDFFRWRTAPALSSYFDAEFWTRLVFQISQDEPAIRHAMVALGALHEQREESLKTTPADTAPTIRPASEAAADVPRQSKSSNEQFALVQYGKAITHLSDRLNSDSSIEVALLACILFVTVEYLRGDPEPALQHLKGGMKIANSLLTTNGTPTATDSLQRIREHILPFLNRIELVAMLYGNDQTWSYPVDLLETVPHEFKSIKEARDSVIHLMNLSVRFIRYMTPRKYDSFILPDNFARRDALLRQLDVWANTLDKMLLSGTLTSRELAAAKTLRIHQIIASSWLPRSLSPKQSVNDNMIGNLEIAISLAEAVYCDQLKGSNSSTFVFDMEIVSPTYYIATKCRHPIVRRRAITLLKRMQRREGLWDSNRCAAIAERVVQHEEVDLRNFDGSELPSEEVRIHGSQIESEAGMDPKVHVVTFHSYPDGVHRPRKVWKEQLTLP